MSSCCSQRRGSPMARPLRRRLGCTLAPASISRAAHTNHFMPCQRPQQPRCTHQPEQDLSGGVHAYQQRASAGAVLYAHDSLGADSPTECSSPGLQPLS